VANGDRTERRSKLKQSKPKSKSSKPKSKSSKPKLKQPKSKRKSKQSKSEHGKPKSKQSKPKQGKPKLAPSPYATGGGGVLLEQKYGATVLAGLLSGDPVPGLGDDFTIDAVALQASQDSPLDDLLINGRVARTGAQRTLSVGVRRTPTIGASDEKFVKLIADAIRTLQKHAAAFDGDQHRLLIAVGDPHPGAQELAELAERARAVKGPGELYKTLATPGLVSNKLRKRFEAFDSVVEAAKQTTPELAQLDKRETCWRLLRSLWIHRFRLEEDDVDRTQCVSRLRTIVNKAEDADALFDRLCLLAAQFAKEGGDVDRTLIRRVLSGQVSLGRDPALRSTWDILDSLAQSLRDRTPAALRPRTAVAKDVKIERADALSKMVTRIQQTAREHNILVVIGDPGVGKSALVLQAMDSLAAAGAAVTMLSLRDIAARSTVEVEQLIGGRLVNAFGATAVAPERYVLMDAAEVVQERAKPLVADLVRAARAAGLTVILVTRSDASTSVVATVNDVVAGTNVRGADTYEVEGFTDEETDLLVRELPALTRVASEPRSKWLLQRPGLLKLVVEHDLVAQLPLGPLCETTVYGLIWQGLIRRNERIEGDGATPDGRESAVKALVRSLLFPEARDTATVADPRALGSLRSDGVFLPVVTSFVWRTGDQFASDLLRDIAVTQLLITESPRILLDAGVPRWALYALRIAYQCFLLDEKSQWPLTKQLAFGKELSEKDGERWLDVPWEAALTITEPQSMLNSEWSLLVADRGSLLLELLRVVRLRFGNSFLTDPHIGAAIVSLLSDHAQELKYNLEEEAQTVTLRWLRTLARTGAKDGTNPLRVRVRDAILASEDRWGDWYVECLSLLGPDLNAAAEAELRRISVERPFDLSSCIESVVSALSMSVHHPDLLLSLAEQFYIEPDDESGQPFHSSYDYGIRHLHHGNGGLGQHSGWYFGPFRWLLPVRIKGTIALINRMLNHAARIRVEEMRGSSHWFDTSGVNEGIDIDFPGGRRRFVGDSHVWRWYGGRGVGSYPCMSALMALELVVDELVALDMPLEKIIDLLLKDAESLAMAGLVYGALVRHIEKAGELLDPWLANPEVWLLEIQRHLEERQPFGFALRGDAKNADRRLWDAISVAYYLVVFTGAGEDGRAAAERLKTVGHRLVENARKRYPEDSEAESQGLISEQNRVVSCRRWAAAMDRANYQGVPTEDDRIVIEFVVPKDIANQIDKGSAEFLRGQKLYELQHRYGLLRGKSKLSVEQIRADLVLAADLVADMPEAGPPFKEDGIAALAATAIEMHHARELVLNGDEFALSLGVLVSVAKQRFELSAFDDVSIWDVGADRSAASVLPLLLLDSFNPPLPGDELEELREVVVESLRMLAKSRVVGVRTSLVEGFRIIWSTPCESKQGTCAHRLALDVVLDAARYCHFGPINELGQFSIDPLSDPLSESLPGVAAENLSQSRLAAAIGAVGDCAASTCCVADEGYSTLGTLVRAYTAVELTNESYAPSATDDGSQLVASSVLHICTRRDPSLLLLMVEDLLRGPKRCAHFIDALAEASTYGAAARGALKKIWPSVMAKVLDTLDNIEKNGEGVDELLASLLPRPRPRSGDAALEDRLREAGADWIDPAAIVSFMDRWIAHSAGLKSCVDSVACFFLWRRELGNLSDALNWLEKTIDGEFERIAQRSSWLVPWLTTLFEGGKLTGAQLLQVRRIVDSLVASGDARAFKLQQAMDLN
jgi:hypothetical protein